MTRPAPPSPVRPTLARLFAAALVACVSAAPPASSIDLFVDQANGNDAASGLSWGTAKATVTAGLDAVAGPGPHSISVAEGRYVGQLVVGVEVTLLGGFPPGGGARDPDAHPTVLDGNRGQPPVVHFPAASGASVLDGFTVRGGFSDIYDSGGGIVIEDSAPLLRGNVIEGNNLDCYGGGVAISYSAPGLAARLEGNVIRRNSSLGCVWRIATQGGGVWIDAPPGMDLGTILSGNRVEENAAHIGGGVFVRGRGRIEDCVIRANSSGLALRGAVGLFNVMIADNRGPGLDLGCDDLYRLASLTVAGNSGEIVLAGRGGVGSVDVVDSIFWSNGPVLGRSWLCSGSATAPVVAHSLVQGGFPGGVNVLDADPLFTPGALSTRYLSHVAAGEPAMSPAVDAGSAPATALGLDGLTTRTDSAADTGTVDLGYHAPRVAALTIMRGAAPRSLLPHRVVTGLPFADDPGTLSDPGLPRLFYLVPEATTPIRAGKERGADTVMLAF